MALYFGPRQSFGYPNRDEIRCFPIAFVVREWESQPRRESVEGSELRFFPLSHYRETSSPLHKHTIEDYNRYNGILLFS